MEAAIEECFLFPEALLQVVAQANPHLLGQLSSTCKFLKFMCSQDEHWHKIFGPTLAVVPKSATNWLDRYRRRSVVRTIEEGLQVALNRIQSEEGAGIIILPPAVYNIYFAFDYEVGLEGYLPSEHAASDETSHSDHDNTPHESAEPPAAAAAAAENSDQPKKEQNKSRLDKPVIKYDQKCSLVTQYDEECSFKNLTFKHEYRIVQLSGGKVRFENCDFFTKDLAVLCFRIHSAEFIKCNFFSAIGIYVRHRCPILVEDCTFTKCSDGAISFHAACRAIVRRSTFKQCGGTGAIDMASCTRLTVEDCAFERTTGLAAIFAAREPVQANSDDEDEEDEDAAVTGNDPAEKLGQLTLINSRVESSKWNAILISHEMNASIIGCSIFHNGSIGVEISKQTHALNQPTRIVGCKVFDNEIDGIFAHQKAKIFLSENEVYQNKGKGIFISSDSARTVEDNNKVYGNVAGQLVVEPFDAEAAQRVEAPDEISKLILSAVQEGRCTYMTTGPHYYVQKWYHCRTCGLIENEGCCEVCRDICHKGHDVDLLRYNTSIFFCDCGATMQCKACKKN